MANYFNRNLLLLIFTVLSLTGWSRYVVVPCEKGQADLTEIDFSQNYIRLSGDWEFYYNQLLSPDDLNLIETKEYGYIPGFWKHYGKEYTKFGYATYKLSYTLGEKQLNEPLTMRIANVHNAYKIWFNGKVVSEVGKVGGSYEHSTPRWLPVFVDLENPKINNEIVIQVCNFRHRNGGIQDPVEIGRSSDFHSEYNHQYFSEIFLGGSAFILGCFFIGMFFFWKKDRAALYFGFFSVFFSLRVILVGTRSIAYTFPDIPWEVLIRLEYISMFLMHYFMFHFVYHAFRDQTSKNYLTVLKVATAILVGFCLIPGDWFTYSTIPNNYFLLLTFVYTVYIFFKGLKANVPGAIWAILSMGIFFLTTIPMILEYSNLFIADPVILSVSYIGFMFSMSLVFAARFGSSFYHLESLKNSEEEQKREILRQKERVVKSNQLIRDSINYAQGIQQSMLPSDTDLRNVFGDCFVFFNPEGKVSGDFYWSRQRKDGKEALISIADCTGHGVPGAFISLIAISALDNLVEKKTTLEIGPLLLELNEVIHDRLSRSFEDGKVAKEGLDISLCKVNFEEKKVWFTAAHHKMLYVRKNGEYEVFQGDNHHLGMPVEPGYKFKENELQVEEGDQIYLFTDGVYDQKGGEKGKKLYLKRMIEEIVKNKDLPISEQKTEFEAFMKKWMGGKTQMDDMLLFGIRF